MKIQEGDILCFSGKPDQFEYDQLGTVLATSGLGSPYVQVGLIPKLGTPDSIARDMLFFVEDERSSNGMNSWDINGNWKVESVWRPD